MSNYPPGVTPGDIDRSAGREEMMHKCRLCDELTEHTINEVRGPRYAPTLYVECNECGTQDEIFQEPF